MTIEERLDALTQRHEALTMNLELMSHQKGQDSENIRALARMVETHDRQQAQDVENIRALARIAEIHEHGLEHRENGEQ